MMQLEWSPDMSPVSTDDHASPPLGDSDQPTCSSVGGMIDIEAFERDRRRRRAARRKRLLLWAGGTAGIAIIAIIVVGAVRPFEQRPANDLVGRQHVELTDAECEQLMLAALDAPPDKWICEELDPFDQSMEFHEWYFEMVLVPEIYPTVNEWPASEDTEIDTVVTNKPTGAQYHLTGRKGSWGVWCSIKFIGGKGWESLVRQKARSDRSRSAANLTPKFDSSVETPFSVKSPPLATAPRPFFPAILGFYG
jgi:hypothetical protein